MPTYTITVTHEFCAAHTLTIAGAREPLHGHNFVTKATIAGDTLDDDGLLCDFHTVHDVLVEICNPFMNQNFNEIAPFDTTNPSAELIARHIGEELAGRLDNALAPNARVHSVSITEAPGCVATYTRP
jgi:6-pyruvoyltetrahydropterin/6-carboxytetrahydropterin synthase